MPSRTKAGLNLADKNSYVRVEENINNNLLKIDDDVDGTWGGLYGGYIQDETITKEVGKRYIDEFNKKAYICIKPSNVNTEDAYTECNVVSNLSNLEKLKNVRIENLYSDALCFQKIGNVGFIQFRNFQFTGDSTINIPSWFVPGNYGSTGAGILYGGVIIASGTRMAEVHILEKTIKIYPNQSTVSDNYSGVCCVILSH